MLRTSTFSETSFAWAMMAERVFWIFNPQKIQIGVLPFWVYNCMNSYENFVSIHNITNSTDLRDLIFLYLFLGLLMPHGVGF